MCKYTDSFKYDIVFTDGVISEVDAQSVLDQSKNQPEPSSQATTDTARDVISSWTYEVMDLAPYKYLCSIPIVPSPPPENETANELARAQEAKELSQAAGNGWDLISDLQKSCLYHTAGWWTYSFCNNRKVTQYHASQSPPPGEPPKADPRTQQFVLGSKQSIPDANIPKTLDAKTKPIPAELQVNGDQRYLAQKLVAGTLCDLTLRERSIEVQYHCVPGLEEDRIAWVKEVTICSYVMVVNTGHLCKDAAFRPPKASKPYPIHCQLISNVQPSSTPQLDRGPAEFEGNRADEGVGEPETGEAGTDLAGQPQPVIGGITIGSREHLSTADEPDNPFVISPPRNLLTQYSEEEFTVLETIAATKEPEEGKKGVIEVMHDSDMEKLGLDPSTIDKMITQIESVAPGKAWRLVLVRIKATKAQELRVLFDQAGNDTPAKEDAKEKPPSKDAEKKISKGEKKAKPPKKEALKESADDTKEEEVGSQEEFKDEL